MICPDHPFSEWQSKAYKLAFSSSTLNQVLFSWHQMALLPRSTVFTTDTPTPSCPEGSEEIVCFFSRTALWDGP